MEKKVNISGIEYPMKSSTLTLANYKNIFGMDKDFGEDYSKLCLAMREITKIYKSDDEDKGLKAYAYLGTINEIATRIAYVMIKEADKSFKSYDEWASTLNNATKDFNWIQEVVGIASYVF